jgi:hypothetical protein
MTKTWIAAVVVALALPLAGCGSSGGSGGGSGGSARSARSADDTKAAKAISAAILKNENGGGATDLVSLTKAQADCIGNGMVDKVGTKDLQTYKLLDGNLEARNDVTAAHMSASDAKATTDVFFGCADVKGLVKKAVGASTAGSSSKLKNCIDKALTEANLRAFLTATFEGKSAQAQSLLTRPLSGCVTAG